MPKWSDYKQQSRERGSLAFELFVVQSHPAGSPEAMKALLPDHLAYQAKLEAEGKLFLAGPMSDETGEEMAGIGHIIYRAGSLDEARNLAAADPMHANGGRTFTVRRWLVNEGSLNLHVGLSTGQVSIS